MKLYIPTTTLNFNNILSTDSISPKGFYSERGFGYSRWFSVPENDMDGAILLYEAPANHIRPSSDIEDHPLLIEVNSDEDLPTLQEGVRYSKKTIYFDPWNTKFIFQNDKDVAVTKSLSDSSSETKMMRLYLKSDIIVKSFQGCFPRLKKVCPIPLDHKSIEFDIKINKMKGLLYGYYIGANLSASKDDISKLNLLREIQNIFAAVSSSLERKPTSIQMERLCFLFGSLNKEEPIYKELLSEIGKQETTDNVMNILQRYGHNIFKFSLNEIVDVLQNDSGGTNRAILQINNEIVNQELIISQHKKLLSVNDRDIIISDGIVSKISTKEKLSSKENKLYLSWVNNLLTNSKYNGKVSSMKESLSDELTQLAMKCLGDDWKDSNIRVFLNQLRRHVRGDEFSQQWENGLLSSIAAVITKGDEWEPLLRFLQSKGITDYRIAFSFYGVLNGFANLTRDFTDNLLNQEGHYVSEIYREFHDQLHGTTINVHPDNGQSAMSGTNQPINTTVPSDSYENRADETILDPTSLKSIVYNRIAGLKISKERRDSIEKALSNTTDGCYHHFLEKLDGSPGFIKKLKNLLWTHLRACPEYDNSTMTNSSPHKKKNDELRLFDEKHDGEKPTPKNNYEEKYVDRNTSLLLDSDWIIPCVNLISDTEAQGQFKKDINWFIENHHEWYYDEKKIKNHGKYYKSDPSNQKTLERLKFYLENKKESKQKWLADKYTNIPVDKIMQYMQKKYGN